MAEFNLAELLADVSELGVAREQIEYIPLSQLDADARNFYQLTDVKELAANIELIGLQQPIRVRANPEQEGRYIVVSGHRRRAAMQLLADEENDAFREAPCIVEASAASDAMQELRLIYANSDTRRMSPAEISKQVERVEALLYQLKEEGVEFPGRMRDHVAEACKVSKSKIARLKVIREGLIPKYLAEFNANVLPEHTAYELARLPQDFQTRLSKVVETNKLNGSCISKVVAEYNEGKRWETSLTCPSGKSCTHADAALRHDLENSWERCYATKCCLECSSASSTYSPCDRMCAQAKARRAAEKAEKAAQEEKENQKRTNKYQRQTQANARRLLPQIDAAGLSDRDSIQWSQYEGSVSIATIRRYAAGDFENTGTWWQARLDPHDIFQPWEVAKTLRCTTDFLFGLTDEPNGTPKAAGWMPGEQLPKEPCEVLADFAMDEDTVRKLCWFDGEGFLFSRFGATIDLPPIRWMAVPEV